MKQTDTINVATASELIGMTYRQVDHWLRTGLITVETQEPGSGTKRRLTKLDVLKLRALTAYSEMKPGEYEAIASHVNALTAEELTTVFVFEVNAKVAITFDLTIDRFGEQPLFDWVNADVAPDGYQWGRKYERIRVEDE